MSADTSSRPITLTRALECLRDGTLRLEGLLPDGSNYTFLGLVKHKGVTLPAVYKPIKGERPLWDFPENTLAYREVAAYLVSQSLGWDLVPPTVYRPEGPHGPGSLQFFIDAVPDWHYFNITDQERPAFQRVAAFDIVINNADRKAGHVLKGHDGRFWLIDHGVCFNAQHKLRTVIWDFAGQELSEEVSADLQDFAGRLEDDDTLRGALESLLDPLELIALRRRCERLVKAGAFPHPRSNYSYPWPPV